MDKTFGDNTSPSETQHVPVHVRGEAVDKRQQFASRTAYSDAPIQTSLLKVRRKIRPPQIVGVAQQQSPLEFSLTGWQVAPAAATWDFPSSLVK